jgi:nicotinate-nucleotide adenylyltransferase
MPARIGVLGGTFDPVHNGHLGIAGAAIDALDLAKVVFGPAGRPWIKAVGRNCHESGITEAEARLEMVRLAIAGRPGWELSTVDVDRPGPSYSVDTIADLQASCGPAARLFLILGADALAELPRWREPERLARMCTLVCVGRPGGGRPEDLPADHPGRSALFVPGPMLDITATDIRARVRDGLPVGGLAPPAVVEYITRRGLYAAVREESG